ncbi:Hypothetical protein A7982_07385 [Minicystis rosea]|nr:Hypothetical protein A7982_07385 [Minicystis rosea]
MRARFAAGATAAGVLLAAVTGHAQTSEGEKKAAAQALFDEARALTTAGKHGEACPKLAESLRLDASMGTRFYLAECLERTGKTASAWTYYVEVADAARTAGQKDREKYATDRAEALKPRIPRLSIKVPDAARAVPGLEIKRDGVIVGEAQWGIAIPIDPGKHVLGASAPGRKAWSSDVEVKQEGQIVEITIPLLESAAPVVEAAPPPIEKREPPPLTPPPPPRATSGQRIAGFVVGGIGVVGLGVSFGLGGLAIAKKGASNDGGGCDATTNVCTTAGRALRSDALGMATGSTVAFFVGLAAIGTGVALVVTAPKTKEPLTPSVALGPTSASLTWRW